MSVLGEKPDGTIDRQTAPDEVRELCRQWLEINARFKQSVQAANEMRDQEQEVYDRLKKALSEWRSVDYYINGNP